MDWDLYVLVGFCLASLVAAGGLYALNWAYRNGQFNKLESGSTSIFDEDEPMGQVTDRFPEKRRKRRPRASLNRSSHP